MADSTSKNPLSGLKTMSPQAKKGMLVFGVAGVVVLGATAMLVSGGEEAAAIPSSVQMGQVPQGESDPTATVDPEYKKLLDETERRRFEEAGQVPGKMVLPSMVGLTDPNAKPEISQPAVPNPMTQGQGQAQPQMQPGVQYAAAPAKDPQVVQREEVQYAAFMKHLGVVADRTLNLGASLSVVYPQGGSPANNNTQSAGPQALQSQAGPPAQGVAPQGAAPYVATVRAGTVAFATLDAAVSTDLSGPVIATIHDGKYKNGRLIGNKALENDQMVLRFSLLSPADGSQAIQVEAYAIRIDDAKKFGLTSIPARTDYHVLQRYVLPAAAIFARTYGAIASQPEQTVVQTDDGLVQTTPKISSKDRMLASTGAAMEPFIADLARSGNRPITKELDANTEIGVMFARDVVPQAVQGSAPPVAAAPIIPPTAPAQATPAPAPAAPMLQPQYPQQIQAGGYQRIGQPRAYGQYGGYGVQINAYQQ